MRFASRLSLVILVLGVMVPAGCARGKEAVPPERHRLPPNISFQLLHMVDETNGWGVSPQGVFRTDSGATQWVNVTPFGVSDINNDSWFFASPLDGWLLVPQGAGGILYETHDGGETWKSTEVPFHRASFFFVRRGNAYAGWALELGSFGGNQPARLYSLDASGRWALTHDGEIGGISGPGLLPYGGMKYGPVFLTNAKTGWITVDYRDGKYGLYRTDDGGHTWSLQDLPLPSGASGAAELMIEPPFLFEGAGLPRIVLAVQSWRKGGGYSWAFLVSEDAGNSWRQVPGALETDGASPQAGFIDPLHGWVASSKALCVTDDGAENWSKRAVPPGTQQVQFVSPDVGWALTSGKEEAVFRTSDGGLTWLKTYPKE